MGFEDFATSIKSRFAKTRETAEVLNRFFASPPSVTYTDYIRLLKDATTIFRRGSVNVDPLIKQVIVRSPGDIKSLLLQAASGSVTWTEFVKKAEEAAWIAFLERIVGEARVTDEDNPTGEEVEVLAIGGVKQFCRLHGE